MLIRSVQPDDYTRIATVGDAAFPGVPHSAEELQEEDENSPPCKGHRWVAEIDGKVVGTASFFQSQARYHPQKFWMDAFVHPDYQRRGVGRALFEQVLTAIAPDNPKQIRTFSREDVPHGVEFFLRRGFAEGKRTWRSFLDLERVDLSAFSYQAPPEIQIKPLSELMGEPGWEKQLLDLYNQIQIDIPDIDPAATVALEDFRSSQLKSPRLWPELYFIALDGRRWIGCSAIWKSTRPGEADTGITGVRREYRGRDIAWAMKLRSLEAARALGLKRIETQNASTNRAMLAINERLGFEKEPAWVHLVKEL